MQSRRDLRAAAAATPLPAAPAVEHATAAPAPTRRRWLGFVGLGAFALGGVLLLGSLFAPSPTQDPVTFTAAASGSSSPDDAAVTAACQGPSEAGGARTEECADAAAQAPSDDRRTGDDEDERGGDRADDSDRPRDERDPDSDAPDGTGSPAHPDEPGTPGDPGHGDGSGDDDAPKPVIPAPPAPTQPTPPPSQPTPPPSQPSPPPSQPTPPPSQPSPPPVVEPDPVAAPLAFSGIREHSALNLLGIKVISSYTLYLTGEPGATASIRYGGYAAGSVTFAGDGTAQKSLGGSLISLGVGDPMISVSYSDGTPGASIQSPRNSLPRR